MVSIEHILFPTDFSKCATHALAEAVAIAYRYKAKITMLHVIVPSMYEEASPIDRFPTQEEINALAPEGFSGELEVQRGVTRGFSAADKVLSFASTNEVDLIVLGSHGRRGFARALLGSEAERVLRLADCPVLTVSSKNERGLAKAPARILVPFDFSESSDEALRHGLALASEFGAELDLVHVFDEPVAPPFLMDHTGSYVSNDPVLRERCLESMDKHIARIPGYDVKVHKHVIEGRLVPTLRTFMTETRSDLAVIGTRGLSGLDYVLLGSTASHLLRVATCPVLTVHAVGAHAEVPGHDEAEAAEIEWQK